MPLPLVLYNVPARTGCDLLPETIERLTALPSVVAVKEAHGTVQRTQQILDVAAGGVAADCHRVCVCRGRSGPRRARGQA